MSPEILSPPTGEYYNVSAVSIGIPLVCPNCRMKGQVRGTITIYQPNDLGQFFGLKMQKQIWYGFPSWHGNHGGCTYVWKPETPTPIEQNDIVF
jgi:hypothetical protein